MNTRQAILAALKADDDIVDLLGDYKGNASLHFDRPPPQGAGMPIGFISPNLSPLNEDKVRTLMPIEQFMVTFYGKKIVDTVAVEQLAERAHALFHRRPGSIDVDGRQIVMIVSAGPVPAPGDDDNTEGRMVTLTVRQRVLS